MLGGATLLFLLVVGLFLLTLLRPGFGKNVSPSAWVLVGGLLLPLPILTVLLLLALVQGEHLLRDAPEDRNVIHIRAHAKQWQWEFFYPDRQTDGSSVNVLHIPAARLVRITATSEDVVHSFWVPRLGGKIDATPGHTTSVLFMADRPGRFGGICSEYCGTGHSSMRFEVQAHESASYEAILQNAVATGRKGR